MTSEGVIAIEGGHLIDPAAGIDAPRDLLLENGKVRAVEAPGAFRTVRVVGSTSNTLVAAPGPWAVG